MFYLDNFLGLSIEHVTKTFAKKLIKDGKIENLTDSTFSLLSESEQYIVAVSNRLIHLNNLVEEIKYGFEVFEKSSIPDFSEDSFDHFIFCQRNMDFHIAAIRDRTLQLIATVFCIQKSKEDVNWKIFDDPSIPPVAKEDFRKFCAMFEEYNKRKNIFFHRESLPVVMIKKNENANLDFPKNFAEYKINWQKIVSREIKLFKNLEKIYVAHLEMFEGTP